MKSLILILTVIFSSNVFSASPLPYQSGDTHILEVIEYDWASTLFKASSYKIKVKNLGYEKKFYFSSQRNGHGEVKEAYFLGQDEFGNDLFRIRLPFIFDDISIYLKMGGKQYQINLDH